MRARRSRIVHMHVIAALAGLSFLGGIAAFAQPAPPIGHETTSPDNAVLLTIIVRHDESRPLGQLDEQLSRQGFYKAFPPPGIEVVSWVVAMGLGQIVTLRLPAMRLREVNRVLEDTAWGAYRTEFYPTYDYKTIGLAQHQSAK